MINQIGSWNIQRLCVPIVSAAAWHRSSLKPLCGEPTVADSLFLYVQRFIKHFNGRLYGANKRSVPTEALNPLRFDDDDHAFVIGPHSGLLAVMRELAY